jgi:hypothetical protein
MVSALTNSCAQGALQQVGGNGRFAGAVRTGQDDQMRALGIHGVS